MKQSELQSLIALVVATRKELVAIREIMIDEGEIHFELAEPMTPIGKLNFKKLNYTMNEIRKIDRKLKKLDNILPKLKKELKIQTRKQVNYNNSPYTIVFSNGSPEEVNSFW